MLNEMLLAIFMAFLFLFTLTNGFIDGGSLVATVITTRILPPLTGLIVVIICEIVGLFLLGHHVIQTFGRIVIFPEAGRSLWLLSVIAAGLLGALIWNFLMWLLSLPSSSSHALLGGLLGAVMAAFGWQGLNHPQVFKVFLFLAIVPVCGAIAGYVLTLFTRWIGEHLTPAAGIFFRALQVVSLIGVALAHGSNDGQKNMGMLFLALTAAGLTVHPEAMPLWAYLFCGGGIALGVVFGSGRIIKTVGHRLFKIDPVESFCAETGTFALVAASSLAGYPMSTSHVMSTSILGAGIAVHPRGVRWELAVEMMLSWLITVPVAAALAAVLVEIMKMNSHVVS
jgi:PiT family inorganic phosphate transporter